MREKVIKLKTNSAWEISNGANLSCFLISVVTDLFEVGLIIGSGFLVLLIFGDQIVLGGFGFSEFRFVMPSPVHQ